MGGRDDERRDPFAPRPGPSGLSGTGGEPVEDALAIRAAIERALGRRAGKVRGTPVRPSEKRRRHRRVGVTFSDPEIPERLRRLALRWGLLAPDGRSPNVSRLVEYLLLPELERAERGEVGPPEE